MNEHEVLQQVTAGLKPTLSDSLNDIATFARRFVRFRSEFQVVALVLWVAHCYAIEAAVAAAYLRISSAVEESGKTTLLEVLELLLGDRAINAVSISPASVFRTRDKLGPIALLLDEVDNTVKDRKDDGARDLLALVNAGYRRSAAVIRTVGPNHEVRRFAAFGPAAIAGIGSLHPTTESRCVPIILDRKLRGEGERWLPFLLEGEAAAIREQLEMWVSEPVIQRLRTSRPFVPPELRDRHAEVWWSLFAIAALAGGDWPERARAAAVILHSDRDSESASLGVLLLGHIRQALADSGSDRLPTASLLRRLVEFEEGPWGRWWGAELNRDGPPRAAAADLARHLRPFGVRPKVIKLGDGSTARGYHLEDFVDPFSRYLPIPPVTDVTNVTPVASTVTGVTSVTGGSGGDGASP